MSVYGIPFESTPELRDVLVDISNSLRHILSDISLDKSDLVTMVKSVSQRLKGLFKSSSQSEAPFQGSYGSQSSAEPQSPSPEEILESLDERKSQLESEKNVLQGKICKAPLNNRPLDLLTKYRKVEDELKQIAKDKKIYAKLASAKDPLKQSDPVNLDVSYDQLDPGRKGFVKACGTADHTIKVVSLSQLEDHFSVRSFGGNPETQIVTFRRMISNIDSSVSAYRTELFNLLTSVSRSKTLSSYSGNLNTNSLYKVCIPGNHRFYKQSIEGNTRGYDISILLDCSSSMNYPVNFKDKTRNRFTYAFKALIILIRALQSIPRISLEVLGFNDGHRTNNIFEFKPFNSSGVKFKDNDFCVSLFRFIRDTSTANYDAEAIEVAASRLLGYNREKGNHKLLIVISDGSPSSSLVSDTTSDEQLRKVLFSLERKLPVFGIGLGYNVAEYYKNSCSLSEENIPEFYQNLKNELKSFIISCNKRC
jgi:hypothetical protein